MKKFITILLLACCIQATQAQQYQIAAELTGFENGTKFYLANINTEKTIDSAVLINGKFTMKGKISKVSSLRLYSSDKNGSYFTNLLMGPEQIKIEANIKDFPWYVIVTGSKSQDVAKILNDQIKHLWQGRDSLMKIAIPLVMGKQSDSIKAITKPLIKKISLLDSTREAITGQFILKYLNSDAGLQQLYYKKKEYKKEVLDELIAKIKPEYKNSMFATLLFNYQKVGKILQKGDQFYDFAAKDLAGNSYQLSAYKGKYILLDFVETYCGPCMESAKDLEHLSKKYQNELQIISFYVETDPKIVQIGLDRDRPTWPAIWDGKGHDGEIKLKYGVSSYPTFVLIAPDGKIVMHSSGFAKDDDGKGSLEKEIDRLLQKAK